MIQQHSDNQSHGENSSNVKTEHLTRAVYVISVLGASAYILADVSGHWNDWWMEYGLVPLFVIACSYFLGSLLREHFGWSVIASIAVSIICGGLFGFVVILAYRGASAASVMKNPHVPNGTYFLGVPFVIGLFYLLLRPKRKLAKAVRLEPLEQTGPVKVADGPKFKSLSQIFKSFPRKHIPPDGKWPPSNEAVNSILEKRLVGCQARVSIEVDLAWKHPDGPNPNVAFILARFTEHPIINLPVLFYAYFNKATPEQAEAVLSRKKHDRVYIVGKITRADLINRDDKGVCLNIDLHDCEFVKP